MSDRTAEEVVAVAALSTAECWRAHQATGTDVDPANPARRFAEWHAGGCAGTLNLVGCGLSSLPAALCEVAPRIRSLVVSDNHLRSLPGALLARCTALLKLYCDNNQLSALPAELGFCTALEILNCGHNHLSSLPAELGACTALQDLHCYKNQLLSLPAELGACTALQMLDFFSNQISSLPAELGACVELQILDCGKNKMSTLPAHLGLPPDLETLDCAGNPFVEGAPTTIVALRAAAAELGRHTKRARVEEVETAASAESERPRKRAATTGLGSASAAAAASAAPPVVFSAADRPFGQLSNFWPVDGGMWFGGVSYATSEHAYQAQKFLGKNASPADLRAAALVKQQSTPYKAKLLAGQRPIPQKFEWQRALGVLADGLKEDGARLRPDWEDVKVDVMRRVLRSKFLGNAACCTVLLATGTRTLIERSATDTFWGQTALGIGRNMLGTLLMELRDLLPLGEDTGAGAARST